MFSLAGSGDLEDYMKRFLQTLVIEIAEVYLKATFLTSCHGHLVLCTGLLLSLWLGVTTERTIRFHRPVVWRPMMLLGASCSLLNWAYKNEKNSISLDPLPCLGKKGSISFFYALRAHGVEAT